MNDENEEIWERIRANAVSTDRPEEWPKDIYSISMEGANLLGIHKKTNKLYWDGHEIVTKKVVRLRSYELFLASVAAFAAFGIFLLSLGSAFSWWN